MSKTVLIVHAHPDRASLNAALTDVALAHLRELGHRVLLSDLYAMRWKAGFDAQDFLDRKDNTRLDLITESGHAYASRTQTADVTAEQQKLATADAVIFQFPLWWFGLPAILKGWIDRVFAYGLAYGYRDAGNTYRYGEGGLAGKRALLSTTVGGPAIDYSPRGINGPLEDLLFPVTHGALFFAGMTVLPTHAIFDVGHLARDDGDSFAHWRSRLNQISRHLDPNGENAHNLALRQRPSRRFIDRSPFHFLTSTKQRRREKCRARKCGTVHPCIVETAGVGRSARVPGARVVNSRIGC